MSKIPPITVMLPTAGPGATSGPAAPPPAAFGAVGSGVLKRPSPSAPPAAAVSAHQRTGHVHHGMEVDSNYSAARFPPSYEEIIKNPVGSISKAKAALVCAVCNSNVVYSLEPEPPELVICPHCNEASVVTAPKDKLYLRCPAPCSCLIAYERDASNVLCPRCNRVLDAPPPVTHVGLIPQTRQPQPPVTATKTTVHATHTAERRPLTERMQVDDGSKRASVPGGNAAAAVSIRRPSDAGSTSSHQMFAGVRPIIFLFLGVTTLVIGIGLFIGLAVGGTFSSSPLWIIMPSGLVVVGLFLLAIYLVLTYII